MSFRPIYTRPKLLLEPRTKTLKFCRNFANYIRVLYILEIMTVEVSLVMDRALWHAPSVSWN